MKLPNFKRILFNDYPEESRGVIQQLSLSLNNAIESLINALNKNLTLKDNIACEIRDITLSVNSSGTPLAETTMTLSLPGNPAIIGTQVILVKNLTNSSVYPTSGVFISFTQTSSGLVINNVTGLPPNNQFLLRVVAYA